ncbi:MAG: DUF2490 domain-containing protein [Lewinellaceae bacterium]|nr:DUF2490 domain-containing protein [Lewinellaceae bacterium]
MTLLLTPLKACCKKLPILPLAGIVFFYLATATSLAAQPADLGNWYIYFGNKQLNQRWNWWHEIQYRNYNAIGDLEQLLIRTGIGYDLTPGNNNLLLGYGFVRTEPYIAGTDEKRLVNEHRLYQQFMSKQALGRGALTHRLRVEERWVEGDFRWRFRSFLSLNYPLTKPKLEPKALYLSIYNEIFLNTRVTVFDRNRLYGALGYIFSKNLKVETGLMSQITERSTRPQWQIVVFNTLPAHNKSAE